MKAELRIAIVWAALIGLGLASVWLNGHSLPANAGFSALIAIAAVKAMLVALFFMHMAEAPWAWRLGFLGLIGAIAVAIVGLRIVG